MSISEQDTCKLIFITEIVCSSTLKKLLMCKYGNESVGPVSLDDIYNWLILSIVLDYMSREHVPVVGHGIHLQQCPKIQYFYMVAILQVGYHLVSISGFVFWKNFFSCVIKIVFYASYLTKLHRI